MHALRTDVQPNAVGGLQNAVHRRRLCASCITASEASGRRSVPGLPRWSWGRAFSNLVTRARPVGCWSEVFTWDPRASADNRITDVQDAASHGFPQVARGGDVEHTDSTAKGFRPHDHSQTKGCKPDGACVSCFTRTASWHVCSNKHECTVASVYCNP